MNRSWAALVFAPTLALGTQSVLYAMVTPSCGVQMRVDIHLVAAAALLVAIVLTLLAYGESSVRLREPPTPDHDGAHEPVPRRFLADIAAAVAALSALVILAMWFGVWVLSPCELL